MVILQRQGQANGDTPTETPTDTPTNVPGQVLPLTETTNEANIDKAAPAPDTAKEAKPRAPRQPKQRGPPEDGIPSKNKVMVANLPYDLSEEKVRTSLCLNSPSPVLTISTAQGVVCPIQPFRR